MPMGRLPWLIRSHYADVSFTMANSKSFSSPNEILSKAQENKY